MFITASNPSFLIESSTPVELKEADLQDRRFPSTSQLLLQLSPFSCRAGLANKSKSSYRKDNMTRSKLAAFRSGLELEEVFALAFAPA